MNKNHALGSHNSVHIAKNIVKHMLGMVAILDRRSSGEEPRQPGFFFLPTRSTPVVPHIIISISSISSMSIVIVVVLVVVVVAVSVILVAVIVFVVFVVLEELAV